MVWPQARKFYDPIANTWTPTVNMVYGRQGAAAVQPASCIGDLSRVVSTVSWGHTSDESSYVFFTPSSRGVRYADRAALIQ